MKSITLKRVGKKKKTELLHIKVKKKKIDFQTHANHTHSITHLTEIRPHRTHRTTLKHSHVTSKGPVILCPH